MYKFIEVKVTPLRSLYLVDRQPIITVTTVIT